MWMRGGVPSAHMGERGKVVSGQGRLLLCRYFGEFQDFEVLDVAVDVEAYEGGFEMETLASGGAGIDVQEVEVVVVHDFEDVAVATDEDVGLEASEGLLEGPGVVSGVASDVGHEDPLAFAGEHGGLVALVADVPSVAVAEDGPHRLPGFQLFEHAVAAVAGVPQLVAVFEKGPHLLGYEAVSVGEDAYLFHLLRGFRVANWAITTPAMTISIPKAFHSEKLSCPISMAASMENTGIVLVKMHEAVAPNERMP